MAQGKNKQRNAKQHNRSSLGLQQPRTHRTQSARRPRKATPIADPLISSQSQHDSPGGIIKRSKSLVHAQETKTKPNGTVSSSDKLRRVADHAGAQPRISKRVESPARHGIDKARIYTHAMRTARTPSPSPELMDWRPSTYGGHSPHWNVKPTYDHETDMEDGEDEGTEPHNLHGLDRSAQPASDHRAKVQNMGEDNDAPVGRPDSRSESKDGSSGSGTSDLHGQDHVESGGSGPDGSEDHGDGPTSGKAIASEPTGGHGSEDNHTDNDDGQNRRGQSDLGELHIGKSIGGDYSGDKISKGDCSEPDRDNVSTSQPEDVRGPVDNSEGKGGDTDEAQEDPDEPDLGSGVDGGEPDAGDGFEDNEDEEDDPDDVQFNLGTPGQDSSEGVPDRGVPDDGAEFEDDK